MYLSHFILEKVVKGLILVMWGELETEQTAAYWPQIPLTIAALLPHPAGQLKSGSWGPKSSQPRTATRTPTNLNSLWHLNIQLFYFHMLPVGVGIAPNSTMSTGEGDTPISTGCTCYLQGVHLLLDSSVEGQYVIYIYIYIYLYIYISMYMCVNVCVSKISNTYVCIYIYIYQLIGQVGRVFANGPGDLVSIPGHVIPKTLKWYLILPCLTLRNIRYVSNIKLSNPEKGVAPAPTPSCCSYWKGSLLITLNYGH